MIGNALRNLIWEDRAGRCTRAGLAGAVLVVVPSLFGAHAPARRPHVAPPPAKAERPRPIAVAGASASSPAAPNLAGLRSSRGVGVSTRPVMAAVATFVQALPLGQQVRAGVPVDAGANLDPLGPTSESRPGLHLAELAPAGREALANLLATSLAAPGLGADEGVARLRQVLADPAAVVDHVTLLGSLGGDEAWGWQLDGRHLSVTYLVAGDVVVVAPTPLDAPSPLVAVGRVNPPSAP